LFNIGSLKIANISGPSVSARFLRSTLDSLCVKVEDLDKFQLLHRKAVVENAMKEQLFKLSTSLETTIEPNSPVDLTGLSPGSYCLRYNGQVVRVLKE
jgi:hypothetical protein